MVPIWAMAVVLAGACVVAIISAVRWRRRMAAEAPREVQRYFRRQMPMAWAMCILQLCVAWVVGQPTDPAVVVLAGSGLLVLGSFAYLAYRQPTEAEAQRNFAADPRLCGKCAYDLRGNVSGVCPECGWRIPKGDRVEAQDPSRA